MDKDKLNELLERLVKTGDEVCMVQRTCEGCTFDISSTSCTISRMLREVRAWREEVRE